MISPCTKVCVIDTQTDTCLGCGRKMAEIAAWSRLSEAARRTIMDRLAARPATAKGLEPTL